MPGSVSIMIRFFGAIAALEARLNLRPGQQDVRDLHVDLHSSSVSVPVFVFVSVHLPAPARLPAIPMQWNRLKGSLG